MGRTRVFTRFVVVNAVNTALYYGLYLLLLVAMPYVLANVAALVAAILAAYVMNARWAFQVRLTGRSLVAFVVSNLTTTVLRTFVLWLLVAFAGMGEWLAPLVATALTLPVAFLLTSLAMSDRPVGLPARRMAEAATS